MKIFSKVLLLALFAPVSVCGARAQAQTIAGVEAPNAITLKVTKVTATSEPKHVAPDNPSAIESSSGYKMVAESATVRYELSCTIARREEHDVTWAAGYDNHQGGSPVWMPQCTQFHVGAVVTFYSLENLVWLSYTDGSDTFTHNQNWKSELQPKFYTVMS